MLLQMALVHSFFYGWVVFHCRSRQWHPLQYSCLENPMDGGASWAAVHGVAESWTWLSDFTFTFHFHALEKEMATHSSVLAWRIPGMGSHRVGHDWSDLAAAAGFQCMCVPYLLYLFICWWTFRLLPCLSSCKYIINIGVHVTFQITFFAGYMPRSGIAGSYGRKEATLCSPCSSCGELCSISLRVEYLYKLGRILLCGKMVSSVPFTYSVIDLY